jgi:hypothetical protein
MKVQVHHKNAETGEYLHIADVAYNALKTEHEDFIYALDYALRRTQNFDGSWSKGPWVHDARNWDYSPDVTVLVPLKQLNGIYYGHRSTMVGDRMVYEGETWEVDNFGFKTVTA